jgi:2-keto-4-pentenoate hydratase/2-oxohepta-3-ene-1,7-dioic acid hydratase in catechol pathway
MVTITVATVATSYIAATKKNYVALYIIGKDITYRDILRRSKKSLKLSLGLPIKTSLVNSTTN